MENPGLGSVKEVVGYESPNRYNRIENVPLYAVEELLPDLAYDGISGITSDAELSAVIIPDTLIPNVDDLLVFNYHETLEGIDNYRLYRVTDIDLSNLDSNSYYRINLISTSYDKEILDSHQIIDDYNLIYGNIGTSDRTILLQDEFIIAGKLEEIYDSLLKSYTRNYYDESLGCFIYSDRYTNNNIYSSDVHSFLETHENILINRKTFMKNIKIIDYKGKDRRWNQKPNLLFYQYIEELDNYGKLNHPSTYELYSNILLKMNKLSTSTFKLLPISYYDIEGSLFLDLQDMRDYFNNVNILNNHTVETSSFINVKNEIEQILYEQEENLDLDTLKAKYYKTQEDREKIHDILFDRIVDKYFITDNEIGDLVIDPRMSPNYLPILISYILNLIQQMGEENFYTSDKIDIIIDYYLNNTMQNIGTYNLNNYYYTPLLLYFVKNFINYLLNYR